LLYVFVVIEHRGRRLPSMNAAKAADRIRLRTAVSSVDSECRFDADGGMSASP
jgi:hypothetical protein